MLVMYLAVLFDLARWQGQVPDWVHQALLWVFILATLTLILPLLSARYMGYRPEVTSSDHGGLPDPGRAVVDERRE